eukprot:jgi/Botrbrau1/2255/Bobra.101_2s0079.1
MQTSRTLGPSGSWSLPLLYLGSNSVRCGHPCPSPPLGRFGRGRHAGRRWHLYAWRHDKVLRGNSKINLKDMASSTNMLQVDEALTIKSIGYSSRKQYYEDCDSRRDIPHIKTPSLLVISRDDPFLGALPISECAANPNTMMLVTPTGGHVAHLEGTLWPFGPSYLENITLDFFDGVLNYQRRSFPA